MVDWSLCELRNLPPSNRSRNYYWVDRIQTEPLEEAFLHGLTWIPIIGGCGSCSPSGHRNGMICSILGMCSRAHRRNRSRRGEKVGERLPNLGKQFSLFWRLERGKTESRTWEKAWKQVDSWDAFGESRTLLLKRMTVAVRSELARKGMWNGCELCGKVDEHVLEFVGMMMVGMKEWIIRESIVATLKARIPIWWSPIRTT